MPRRKTAQPEPLERFYLTDGTEVNVIDESCWPIGRGQHSAKEFATRKPDPIIENLRDILVNSDGIEKVEAYSLHQARLQDILPGLVFWARKAAMIPTLENIGTKK